MLGFLLGAIIAICSSFLIIEVASYFLDKGQVFAAVIFTIILGIAGILLSLSIYIVIVTLVFNH